MSGEGQRACVLLFPCAQARCETLRPEHTLRGRDLEHLHGLWQFDQELGVTFEMMDATRVRAREARHRLDALPIGDRHEFSLVATILEQHLHGQRLLLQRGDAVLVIVFFFLIRLGGGSAAAPDAGDRRLLVLRWRSHDFPPCWYDCPTRRAPDWLPRQGTRAGYQAAFSI